jgi:O-antigen ligase
MDLISIILSILIFSRALIERIKIDILILPITNFGTVFTSIIIIILLLIVVILKKNAIPKIFLSFLLFFIISFFGVFIFSNLGFFIDYIRIFSYFALLWVIREVITSKNIRLFIKTFFCAPIIPVIVGTYQIIFKKGEIQFGEFNRIFATFRHPSDYGYFLLIYIIALVVLWLTYFKMKNKFVFISIISVMVLNIFFTFSRMVWISMVFALCLLLFLLRKKRLISYYFILLSFILMIIFIPYKQQIISRFKVEFGSNKHNINQEKILGIALRGSPLSRFKFIKSAIKEFFKSPLFGRGLGFFYYYFSLKEFGLNIEVHSDVAKLLLETGIIGGLLFFYSFYRIYIYISAHYKLTKDIFTKSFCLIGIILLVTKMIQWNFDAALRLADVEFYWWGFLGIVVGLIKLDKKQISKTNRLNE